MKKIEKKKKKNRLNKLFFKSVFKSQVHKNLPHIGYKLYNKTLFDINILTRKVNPVQLIIGESDY